MCNITIRRNIWFIFWKVHIGLRTAETVRSRKDITAVAQLSCQFFITEDQFHSQATQRSICGGKK